MLFSMPAGDETGRKLSLERTDQVAQAVETNCRKVFSRRTSKCL